MTEDRAAVDILWNHFYEYAQSKANPVNRNGGDKNYIQWFRMYDGQLVLPTNPIACGDMLKRRDDLLGVGFRFTIPLIPSGAKYV